MTPSDPEALRLAFSVVDVLQRLNALGCEPSGRDLRAAIDAALSNKPVTAPQRPSVGCNIKWKPGNEPRYFGG